MSSAHNPPTIITTDLDEVPINNSSPPQRYAQGSPLLGSPVGSPSSPTASDFKTSTALRENYPTRESGTETLDVLNHGRHQRAPSNATFLSADGGKDLSPSTTRYGGSDVRSQKGLREDSPVEMEQVADKKSPFGKLKSLFKKKKEDDASGASDDEEVKFSAHIDPAMDTTDPTPFFHKPYALASLVDPKSLDDLEAMGGIDGLLHGLGVDGHKGLTGVAAPAGALVETGKPEGPTTTNPARLLEAQYKASLEQRGKIYGNNYIPPKKTKNLFQLMWLAMKDKVLVCAPELPFRMHELIVPFFHRSFLVLLLLSLWLSVSTNLSASITRLSSLLTVQMVVFLRTSSRCPSPYQLLTPSTLLSSSVEWVEGVAILVAVSIVVLVGSVNDWQKELQFKKLNEKKDDRMINCIRNGQRMTLNTKDLVVGDVCVLETGEILPVDGVFLRGHNVKCDESGATGESDLIKKFPYEECIEERNSLPEGKKGKKDCFLISGSKVSDGVGEYVVIAVGQTSFNGRLLMGKLVSPLHFMTSC